MEELRKAGRIHEGAMTATGKTMGENIKGQGSQDTDVIPPYDNPLRENAGFVVLSGNLFDSALMKTSVISADFRERFERRRLRGRAVVLRDQRIITNVLTTHR